MEAKLLNAVHQTDTHVRIEASEQLLAYFKSEEASPQDFPDLEHLIAGLAAWLSSSNSKVTRTGSIKQESRVGFNWNCIYYLR